MTLSWYDWKQHLLEHTDEKRFYCFECNVQLNNKTDHTSCPPETIIDVFGDQDVGCSLDGFICQLCDHYQINDYRLMDHLEKKHDDLGALFEMHVARVTLVPDMRPEEHIIQTDTVYVPQTERYRCGIGQCIYHGKTLAEYAEHFRKAHSIIKTYFCPHCNLLMNRMNEPTVAHDKILRHIECHGKELHQCASCELIMTSEKQIQAHMTGEHGELPIKFWRNSRHPDGADSELVDIVLDCKLCGQRVLNVPSALAHFKEVHQGFEIDFKAIKLIKSTTKDLEVIFSMDDSKLHFSEVLVCGLCDQHFSDKHEWLQHFSQAHSTEALAVRRDFKWIDSLPRQKQCEFDRNMLFFCKSCENTDGAKMMCSTTVDGIYEHWKRKHRGDNFIPFQYYVIELVACNYCNVMSTFQGIKEHISKSHPNVKFIPIKAFENDKRCAFCNTTSDDLDEHIRTKHALAMQADVLNPMPLHQQDLWRLLQIKVHQKLKCGYCDAIFEVRDAYRLHHSIEHPKLERMSQLFFDKDSILLIGDCCHEPIDPNVFYDHLEYHKYSLKCDKCTFRTTDPFNFMRHQVECHETSLNVSDLYRNFLELKYWRSELVFGNGLVLNKFNTQGTELDYTANFEVFANRLVAEKMDEYEEIRGKMNHSK